jgi:hypothetical protein
VPSVKDPIACTLDAVDRVERGDEWRAFQREVVVERDRVSKKRLRLRLDHDLADAVTRAVDLARREKACCGFFEFSLLILADATWLEVAVPIEASGILDEFADTTA